MSDNARSANIISANLPASRFTAVFKLGVVSASHTAKAQAMTAIACLKPMAGPRTWEVDLWPLREKSRRGTCHAEQPLLLARISGKYPVQKFP